MCHDPVCGMDVDPEETLWWATYQGETYYFCSLACCERFEKEPERYLTSDGATASQEAEDELSGKAN